MLQLQLPPTARTDVMVTCCIAAVWPAALPRVLEPLLLGLPALVGLAGAELPAVPRGESLVGPAAVWPARDRSPMLPVAELLPLVELPAPAPMPGALPAVAVLPVEALPVVLVPAAVSMRPTISTRCPTYGARSRSPLSRYRMLWDGEALPVPAVAEPTDVPLVPFGPVEVDPVTPPETFSDAPDGIAFAST